MAADSQPLEDSGAVAHRRAQHLGCDIDYWNDVFIIHASGPDNAEDTGQLTVHLIGRRHERHVAQWTVAGLFADKQLYTGAFKALIE